MHVYTDTRTCGPFPRLVFLAPMPGREAGQSWNVTIWGPESFVAWEFSRERIGEIGHFTTLQAAVDYMNAEFL